MKIKNNRNSRHACRESNSELSEYEDGVLHSPPRLCLPLA
jgi:hypothetical protein